MKKRAYGTGSVYKRGSVWVWEGDINGRRVKRSLADLGGLPVRTKGHAERLAADLRRELLEGPSKPDPATLALAEIEVAYQQTGLVDRLNPMTQKNRPAMVARFIERFPRAADITHESLGRYVNERLNTSSPRTGNPLSTATVNREMSCLRRLLTWAEKRGLIERNPMTGFPQCKEPHHRERVLSQDERRRLIEAAREKGSPYHEIVLLALHCGLRQAEILTMTWACVDLNPEEPAVHLLKTKSGRRRKVPLSVELAALLGKLPRESGYVFPSPGNPAKPLGQPKRAWAAIAKAAGLEDLRFHDLRHTAATTIVQALKGDIGTARDVLGHADISTTARYLNPTGAARSAIEAAWEMDAAHESGPCHKPERESKIIPMRKKKA